MEHFEWDAGSKSDSQSMVRSYRALEETTGLEGKEWIVWQLIEVTNPPGYACRGMVRRPAQQVPAEMQEAQSQLDDLIDAQNALHVLDGLPFGHLVSWQHRVASSVDKAIDVFKSTPPPPPPLTPDSLTLDASEQPSLEFSDQESPHAVGWTCPAERREEDYEEPTVADQINFLTRKVQCEAGARKVYWGESWLTPAGRLCSPLVIEQ